MGAIAGVLLIGLWLAIRFNIRAPRAAHTAVTRAHGLHLP